MVVNNNLLQQCTVYAFHVPGINAIKVGFGNDGRTRMIHYSRQYRVSPSSESLREWVLPSPSLASSIETACHRALLQAGFYRIPYAVDEREAKELFDLGHHSYDQAVLVVADAIEVTINALHESLGKIKPLSREKALQKDRDAQQMRASIFKEKKKKQEEKDNQRISAAAHDIQQRWQSKIEPFVKACNNAKILWIQFENDSKQGFLSQIWNGERSTVEKLMQWNQRTLFIRSVTEVFHTARPAKLFYLEMKNKYGQNRLGSFAEQAAERLGLSLYRPGGHHLPFLNDYPPGCDMAILEVRLAVQIAAGCGGDEAVKIMNADPDIKSLVRFATHHPDPVRI